MTISVKSHDAAIRRKLGDVLDWYQSDEEDPRPTLDIIENMASDLQEDRKAALLLHRIVIELRKVDGNQAHRIMPQIWPLLCEASSLMPADPTQAEELKDV